MPTSFAILAPAGLAAMAVSHRVEESVNPAIEVIMRKEPIFFRVPSATFEPESAAKALTMGYKTPERAVLLGKAGEMNMSAATMEYPSFKLDVPNF